MYGFCFRSPRDKRNTFFSIVFRKGTSVQTSFRCNNIFTVHTNLHIISRLQLCIPHVINVHKRSVRICFTIKKMVIKRKEKDLWLQSINAVLHILVLWNILYLVSSDTRKIVGTLGSESQRLPIFQISSNRNWRRLPVRFPLIVRPFVPNDVPSDKTAGGQKLKYCAVIRWASSDHIKLISRLQAISLEELFWE